MAIRDISVVKNGAGGGAQREATLSFDGIKGSVMFSDLFYEGSPVQFEQVEVSGYKVDANGDFFTWRKKSPVVFSISLFPGSKSDKTMTAMLKACAGNVGESAKIAIATIQYSGVNKMTFKDGVLVAGLPGVNANADNRMGAKTFRFAFASFECDATARQGS